MPIPPGKGKAPMEGTKEKESKQPSKQTNFYMRKFAEWLINNTGYEYFKPGSALSDEEPNNGDSEKSLNVKVKFYIKKKDVIKFEVEAEGKDQEEAYENLKKNFSERDDFKKSQKEWNDSKKAQDAEIKAKSKKG